MAGFLTTKKNLLSLFNVETYFLKIIGIYYNNCNTMTLKFDSENLFHIFVC